jgi:phage shock protein PspC (stress-responsive transcriptional regulator)
MIQSIKITINKTTFTLDNDGYVKLNAYVAALKKHFINDAEVLFDIEARIAELLTLHSAAESTEIIGVNIINKVIETIGSIEELTNGKASSDSPNSSAYKNTIKLNKLRRNPFNESLAGVCSGIAAYLRIDASIVRFLFVFSLVVFGTGVAIYIILWIVIPRAQGEELEMLKEYEDNYHNKIYRNKETKAIAGVCSGLAIHLGLEIWIVRLAFFIGLFVFGSAFIVYILAWIIIPFDSAEKQKKSKKNFSDYKEQNSAQVNTVRNAFKTIIAAISLLLIGFIIIGIFFSAAIFDIFNYETTYTILKSMVPFENGLEIVTLGALLCIFTPILFVLALIAKFAFKANINFKYAGTGLIMLFFIGIGILVYSSIKIIPQFANKNVFYGNTHQTLPQSDSLVFEFNEIKCAKESNLFESNGFKIQVCDSGFFVPIEYNIKRTLEDSASFIVHENYSFPDTHKNEKPLSIFPFDNKAYYTTAIRFPTHFFLRKTDPFNFQHIKITFYIPEKAVFNLNKTAQKAFDVYKDGDNSNWFNINDISSYNEEREEREEKRREKIEELEEKKAEIEEERIRIEEEKLELEKERALKKSEKELMEQHNKALEEHNKALIQHEKELQKLRKS